MRFAVLGSGSRGNATLVEVGATRVLLDCGFARRETEQRLGRLGLAAAALTAVVVTHEHGDHASGVFRLARRYKIPVWSTYGTAAACGTENTDGVELRLFDPHEAFAIDDIEVSPFPVPHDAREPAQFVFSDGCRRLGILTDIGESTPHVERMLSGVDALMIECNHDRALLSASRYPASLKSRIGGRLGHLANELAAGIVAAIETGRLRHLVAAHLSAENNRPELATQALAAALDCEPAWVAVADQDEGLPWRDL